MKGEIAGSEPLLTLLLSLFLLSYLETKEGEKCVRPFLPQLVWLELVWGPYWANPYGTKRFLAAWPSKDRFALVQDKPISSLQIVLVHGHCGTVPT